MPKLQQPGNTFCLGVLAGYVALHYELNGWLVLILALGIGWSMNRDEQKDHERHRR